MVTLLVGAALAGEIELLEPGDKYTAREVVFVLPEPAYDACLEKAEALETLKKRVKETADSLTDQISLARQGLSACEKARIAMEADRDLLRGRVVQLKKQRTTLVIAGTVLLGLVALETYGLARTID